MKVLGVVLQQVYTIKEKSGRSRPYEWRERESSCGKVENRDMKGLAE